MMLFTSPNWFAVALIPLTFSISDFLPRRWEGDSGWVRNSGDPPAEDAGVGTFSLSIASPASSTSLSSSSTPSSSSPTPTYSPPSVDLPAVRPGPNVLSPSYQRLTSKLPTILGIAVAISNHSWELGTLTESLLEVYNPQLTPFQYDPTGSEIPWEMLKVVNAALADYSWTGAPGSGDDLASFLDNRTSPIPLIFQPLVDGDGSLGDPNALGVATWLLTKYAGNEEVKKALGLRCPADYAWAVGNQLSYTFTGNTSPNGQSSTSSLSEQSMASDIKS